jgi:hypothetical protein
LTEFLVDFRAHSFANANASGMNESSGKIVLLYGGGGGGGGGKVKTLENRSRSQDFVNIVSVLFAS